jgi:hypothetical protein
MGVVSPLLDHIHIPGLNAGDIVGVVETSLAETA